MVQNQRRELNLVVTKAVADAIACIVARQNHLNSFLLRCIFYFL